MRRIILFLLFFSVVAAKSQDTLASVRGKQVPTADSSKGSTLHVSGHGDSFTQSAFIEALTRALGRQVAGWGVSGDSSIGIRNRFLRVPSNMRRSNIIWSGRNNYTQTANVIRDDSIMAVNTLDTAYIILGIVHSANVNERAGTANYIAIEATNAAKAAKFGVHYIDPNAVVIPLGSTSGTDSIFRSYGQTPQSMRLANDSLHYNEVADSALARVVVNRLISFLPKNNIVTMAGKIAADATTAEETYALDATNLVYGSNALRAVNLTKVVAFTTALGHETGVNDTTGLYNTMVGYKAANLLRTSSYVTALGFQAGRSTNGDYNTYIGANTASNSTTGVQNVVVGAEAYRSNTTGSNNSILGQKAGGATAASTPTFSGMAAVGTNAYTNVTSGQNNVGIGFNIGATITTGANNGIYGYLQDLGSASSNAAVNFHGSLFITGASGSYASPAGSVGIGINTPAASAILDLTSTNKGFVMPRVANTAAITSPATGLQIYSIADSCVRYYDGVRWKYNSKNSTYVATMTIGTNVQAASCPFGLNYTINGNLVTVSGQIIIDGITNGLDSDLSMTLPVASTLGSVYELSGVGNNQIVPTAATIYGNTSTNQAQIHLVLNDTSPNTYSITFSYRIL